MVVKKVVSYKMKKKILIILICLIVLFGISGCGSSNKESDYSFYDTADGRRIWMKN